MTPTTKAGQALNRLGYVHRPRCFMVLETDRCDCGTGESIAAIEAEATAPLLARIAALEAERDRLREFLWQAFLDLTGQAEPRCGWRSRDGLERDVECDAVREAPEHECDPECLPHHEPHQFCHPFQPATSAEPDVVALMRREHHPVPYRWSQSGESGTVCAASIAGLHHRVTSWPCDVESAICAALAAPAQAAPAEPLTTVTLTAEDAER